MNERICCENCVHWTTGKNSIRVFEPKCIYILTSEGDTVCPENPSKCPRFLALDDHEGLNKLVEEELAKYT